MVLACPVRVCLFLGDITDIEQPPQEAPRDVEAGVCRPADVHIVCEKSQERILPHFGNRGQRPRWSLIGIVADFHAVRFRGSYKVLCLDIDDLGGDR